MHPRTLNALAHQWPNVLLYAFPPVETISPVLERVHLTLILGACWWPTKSWYVEIITLLAARPWQASSLQGDGSDSSTPGSLAPSCLPAERSNLIVKGQFSLDGLGDVSRPNATYLSKFIPAVYSSIEFELLSFWSPPFGSEKQRRIHSLCPVCVLRTYIENVLFCDELFVCFVNPARGRALSKQRLSHWII